MSITARDWSSHPACVDRGYRSTALRGPVEPLVPLPAGISELTGPVFGSESVGPLDADLARNGVRNGAPLGERIVITGRVLDEGERPVPDALVEIWQANAADPVLAAVPEARRATLVAERAETPRGVVYRFDVHMQGERETVFFDA